MSPRTYDVRTYGCQMNVHDSERIAGLLEDAGYVRAVDAIRPYWWVRTFTGIAMDIGISLVVYTLMKTSLSASAPAGVAR